MAAPCLVLVLLTFATNVLLQISLCRYGQVSLLRSIFTGFVLGGILLVFGIGIHFGPISLWATLGWLVAGLLTYGALGYGYFHFLNLGETARRVRLLRELLQAGGTLTREDLVRRYSAKTMRTVRLQRLIDSHQALFDGHRYRVGNPSVLRMSKILRILKRTFRQS